ncbi:MAG TPA: hypothetical protein VMV69_11280 [Pirellulales bacterium]|nr:hypothetical protein [Pirellulales bacterium]
MKTVAMEKSDLDACVASARSDRIIVTRDGNPVALIFGIEGMDEEQVRLGASDMFWKLIRERRHEETVDRAALEEKLKSRTARRRRGKP